MYRPGPPLDEFVDWFGSWDRDETSTLVDRVLPRGATTVTIDIGPQKFEVCRSDDRTRLDVPAAMICGAHATSYVLDIPPRSFGGHGAFQAGRCLSVPGCPRR